MKRILVTGGAGFIGSHVVDLLEKKQHQVVVLDDLSSGSRSRLSKHTKLAKVDIRDSVGTSTVIEEFRPHAVIHLAAQANVRRSIEDPETDAEINIGGGISLLKACAAFQVGRVVFASSGGAIYGDQPTYPIPETAEPKPSSPYGLAKQAMEKYGEYFSKSSRFDFVSLRLANVYGPRQSGKGEAGVVAIFLDHLARGTTPLIFGDGSHTRDYVSVRDVAPAFVAALKCPPGTYNIGTGVETRTIDLLVRLLKLTGSSKKPTFLAEIRGEVHRNSLDWKLARAQLSWSPKVTLGVGLREQFQFFRSGNSE